MDTQSSLHKILAAFFAFVLAVTLVPSAALADEGENNSGNNNVSLNEQSGDSGSGESASGESTSDGTSSGTTDGTTDNAGNNAADGAATSGSESGLATGKASGATGNTTTEGEETTGTADTTDTTESDDGIMLLSATATTTVNSADELYNALKNVSSGGSVIIQLGSNIEWPVKYGYQTLSNCTITIDLNGKTITPYGTNNGQNLFRLSSKATLNLYDSETGGSISGFDSQSEDGGVVYVGSGGTFNMYSGTIADSTTTYDGGAVCVKKGGTFNMDGGIITGCHANDDGGAVCVEEGGTFTMSNATIEKCEADDYGGGIYLGKGTAFSLSAGTIFGNHCGDDGGGIYMDKNATLNISGGIISGNNADDYGGGIGASSNTTITITGGTISSNGATKDGGGVYSQGTVNMSAGTVSGNTSFGKGYSGGGIFAYVTNFSGGTISGNAANNEGGGIYSRKLTMTGGTIESNYTDYGAGVAYDHDNNQTNTNKYHMILNGGKIINNEADYFGSGVAAGCRVDVYNTTITGNKAWSHNVAYAGAFAATYPYFYAYEGSTIEISGNTGGDYIRNISSGVTSDDSCARIYGTSDVDKANVNIGVAVSSIYSNAKYHYQKIATFSYPSQAAWFHGSNTRYDTVTESTYWLYVVDNQGNTATHLAITDITVTDSAGHTATASDIKDNVITQEIDDTNLVDKTNLTVTLTYKLSSGSSGTTLSTGTTTFTGQDLSSSAKWFVASSGSSPMPYDAIKVKLKSVSDAEYAAAEKAKGVVDFWGAGLRMDSYVTGSAITYNKTDVRLGFCFHDLPSGAVVKEFGWRYGTEEDNLEYTTVGTNSRAAGSESVDPSSNGTVANIVFTGIDAEDYNTTFYTQMYVTYELNGSTYVIWSDVVDSSTIAVAQAAASDSTATDAQRTYATGIVEAYAKVS